MSSIIGALRVILSADTAQFGRAMKESQGQLQALAADVKTISAGVAKGFAAIGAAAAAMGTAVAYSVHGTMEEFRKVGEASKTLDIPVEKLSSLKYAAEASGASFDTLSSALGTLGGKIDEAATQPATEAAHAFKGLGISIRDLEGNARPSTDVLADIANEFAKYQDGASKTAMATKLFGEAGKELIPFLNRGREGIAELEAEARRLGVTFDEKTTESAKRYQQSLNHLNAAKNALWTQMATRLAPIFEGIADRILAATRSTATMEEVTTLLTGAFKSLYSVGVALVGALRVVGVALKNTWEWLTTDNPEPLINKILADTARIVGQHAREIQSVWSGWETTVKKTAAAGGDALMPWTKGADELKASLEAAKAELQALISSSTADVYEKQAAINEALKEGIISNAESIKLSAQVAADALRQVREEARATWDEIINAPTATFAEKMAATKLALDQGTISLREFGRTTRQIQQENVRHWNDLASAVASGLTSIFGKSKTAAIAAAVINTAQAVTRNLAQYPMPFGGIMAAIAAASGAAQIRAIRSTSMGSSGGGSSPSASAPATPTIPQQQTLFVEGISRDSLFSGDAVRDLATKLLDYQRDGGRVILTET